MSALPKAKSQGSNGGGGGALTAFTGISAAKAEPAAIASTAAAKTSFFMTVPIQKQPSSGAPQGHAITDSNHIPSPDRTLERATHCLNQKRRPSADLLGVMAVPKKIVGAFCNLATPINQFYGGLAAS